LYFFIMQIIFKHLTFTYYLAKEGSSIMVTGILHLNNLVVQSFLEDMDCFPDLQGVYSGVMINVLEDSSQFLEDLLFTLYKFH